MNNRYLIVVCLVAFFILQQPSYASPHCSDTSTVLFIHGFLAQDTDFSQTIQILKEIYPQASEISTWRWEASVSESIWKIPEKWLEALFNATDASEQLFQIISSMSSSQQKSLILIGHSLGARVVIKALEKCNDSNITIDHFVLAGAAINNNDSAIKSAINAAINPSYSLVNMRDLALGTYCTSELNHALGTGYALTDYTGKFKEVAFKMGNAHDVDIYLNKFLNCVKQNNYKSEEILVVQDCLNWRMIVEDKKVFWECLDKKGGWELQQNHVSNTCRILSPNNERMAWGSESCMRDSFKKVKKQLPDEIVTLKTHQDVVVIQDNFNANISTGGGYVWWSNLNEYKGWRLQQNYWTGHCRILDPGNIRRAWGGESTMTKSFNDVIRQLKEFGY